MTHATGSSKSFELPTYNSIWKRRNENWAGRKLSYGMSVPFFFVEQEYKELMETLLENLTFFFELIFILQASVWTFWEMKILGDGGNLKDFMPSDWILYPEVGKRYHSCGCFSPVRG